MNGAEVWCATALAPGRHGLPDSGGRDCTEGHETGRDSKRQLAGIEDPPAVAFYHVAEFKTADGVPASIVAARVTVDRPKGGR